MVKIDPKKVPSQKAFARLSRYNEPTFHEQNLTSQSL